MDNFLKNSQISDFMKICPLGDELFHADRQGWTGRYTYMMKLRVTFCNFVKALKMTLGHVERVSLYKA
jgi:hypothetical protein